VVVDDGDAMVFESADAAASYVEVYEVEDGLVTGFDMLGRALSFGRVEWQTTIQVDPGRAPDIRATARMLAAAAALSGHQMVDGELEEPADLQRAASARLTSQRQRRHRK
jgi:hypothetical protein